MSAKGRAMQTSPFGSIPASVATAVPCDKTEREGEPVVTEECSTSDSRTRTTTGPLLQFTPGTHLYLGAAEC